jgi:hypothetical protein
VDPSGFVEYIAGNPGLKPRKTFDAMGGPGNMPSTPTHWRYPAGKAFVFPEYFAFLTTRRYGQGLKGYGEEVARGMTKEMKLLMMYHRWAVHPASIAMDISKVAKALNNLFSGPEIISHALTNQYSFFFPLSALTGIETGGGVASSIRGRATKKEALYPPYFRLITQDETYVVQQSSELKIWNYSYLKRGYESISSKWNTDALEMLQTAARKNQAAD